MVNVTSSNFLTQLSDFLHHLPTASFIALDEEMTGIQLPESRNQRPNKIELPSERYTRLLKGVPERYSILQVGVALFHKNPDYVPKKSGGSNGGLRVHHRFAEGENDDEHAYMHREGTLNEDELTDLTEREEEDEVNNNVEEEKTASSQSEYTSRIYNFYLFPNTKSSNNVEREMTLNPSTVKFLLDNNMDFDKVFREGISYTTVEHANSLKKRYVDKYHTTANEKKNGEESGASNKGSNGYTPRKGGRVKLTRTEDIAFLARTMAELREWIDTNNDADTANSVAAVAATTTNEDEGTSLVLPPCNAFLRRCLYETIEEEYPILILERADAKNGGGGAAATMKNQIRVIRLSPAEKKRREIRLRQGAWDRVLMDIGFTTLFKAISDACNGLTFTKEQTTGFMNGQFTELSIPSNNNEETGKKIPLIIHNGLQDLMFLLTHCHDATLPESFEDTKKIIRSYFPLIYDTKVLATEYSDAIIKSGSTGLEELYKKTCTEDESESDMSLLKVPPIKNQDGGSQGQAHEAAWDAFMTGCVFNALNNQILETKYDMPLDKLLHNSSPKHQLSHNHLLRTLVGLNKIYMHVSLYTIDLESSSGPVGLHDPLSRGLSIDTTFHVFGITTSVSTRDIFQALGSSNESEEEVIRYEVIWVDDVSFFVGTRVDEETRTITSVTRGIIAAHVRDKLHASLGNNVKITDLGEYLKKKYKGIEAAASGFAGLVSVATMPFQALGSVFGFGKKRSFTDDDNSSSEGGANKRRRMH